MHYSVKIKDVFLSLPNIIQIKSLQARTRKKLRYLIIQVFLKSKYMLELGDKIFLKLNLQYDI